MKTNIWFDNNYLKQRKKDRIRICLPNVTYHTMSRCIEKKSLLMKPNVMKMICEVLKMAQKKYEFKLHDFVIMDNHVHFKIKTTNKDHSISLIMQLIKAQIARRYNKMFNRTGPFWNERFKDSIIEHAEDPLTYANYLSWYFAYNPVKKGLVKKPSQYYYCGIQFYLEKNYQPPIPLEYDQYFLNLGNSFSKRKLKFKQYEKIAIKMLYKQ